MTEERSHGSWLQELKGRLSEVVEEITETLESLLAPPPQPAPVRARRPASRPPRRRHSL